MSEKARKNDETWLVLYDLTGRPFVVPYRTYEFAKVDGDNRRKVEGIEEDGVAKSPAAEMRRELVSALRDQALLIAIAGTTISLPEARIVAATAARSATNPLMADQNAIRAVAQLVKDSGGTVGRGGGVELASSPKVPPLDTTFIHKFNEATGAKIDSVRLARELQANTRQAVRGAETVEEILGSGAFASSRAATIIRTETARAMQEMKLDSIKAKKEWHASPGACKVCMALDGQVLDADVEFYAGPAFGYIQHPPAHPNCRCSIEEAQ